jgi:hypothetical protein
MLFYDINSVLTLHYYHLQEQTGRCGRANTVKVGYPIQAYCSAS